MAGVCIFTSHSTLANDGTKRESLIHVVGRRKHHDVKFPGDVPASSIVRLNKTSGRNRRKN